MKRALLVLLLAGFVKAPAGWRSDDNEAKAIAAKANTLPHFGGASAVASAQVLLPADGPGALYVTAIAGKIKEHRDAAARVEIDTFLATAKRAQLVSTQVSTGKTSSSVDAAKKQIEVVLEWSDQDTETHARMVVAADAETMIAVIGECVFASATTKAARTACDAALTTLDPGIPADKRVALALAPDGTEPPRVETEAPAPTARPPATMTDGSRTPLPPVVLQTETKRTADRRPVYVGLGIVLLAAVFWWNRRRRERFDAEGTDDKR